MKLNKMMMIETYTNIGVAAVEHWPFWFNLKLPKKDRIYIETSYY